MPARNVNRTTDTRTAWRKGHGFLGAAGFFFACVLPICAAGSDYSYRLWQMEDGLPQNVVQALAQTTSGFLWVGTREGLARFDGVRFEPVNLSSNAPHPSVISLLAPADGSLWAGTESEGLFRIRGNTVERLPAPNGSQDYAVFELHQSRRFIWAATSVGLLEWSDAGFRKLADFRNAIESTCVDGSGVLWHSAGGVLRALAPGPATNYIVRSGALPADTRKLYCSPDGAFWLASGTAVTRVKDGMAITYRKADGPAGFVDAFLTDHEGQLWLGAYAGLSRFADGAFAPQETVQGQSYRVYCVFEDAEKTLWIGSEEGLTRLVPQLFRTYTRRDGLTLNSVVTVCAARDGAIWAGIWGGGLNCIKDGAVTAFNRSNGLSSDFVMAMCEGRDGSLWVGTDYGSPLNRIKDGQVTYYGQAQGLVAGAHTALLEDNESALWIGTRDGLQRLHNGRCTVYSSRDGLTHEKVNALCLSADGSLWIGTGAGLTRRTVAGFEDWTRTNALVKTAILSLFEDADRLLWIGTASAGLICLHGSEAQSFSVSKGLLSDSIYSIQEDARGNLWFNSSRGIFRVRKHEFLAVARGQSSRVTPVAYGKTDGILSSSQYREVTQPAACKGVDGKLWFRTTQGAVVVDPARITLNSVPPPVVIEEVIADRKTIWKLAGLELPARVRVPKGRGELEIRYTGLSLRAPERNRFRYRLLNVDPDWVDAGNRRSAYYNKVAPGDYVFEVAASNNDGLWSEAAAALSLRLDPHFWQTGWFLGCCAAFCIGGTVATGAWVTRRRLRRELMRLEQQHAVERERARIARDMHDELGAKLARISFQGATAKRVLNDPSLAGPQVEKMAATARELVTSLDEIVWAVDPGNDTLENLVGYICRHAGQFFEESSISCEFAIPDSLPRIHLASDVRHNLFLATKEALTNVSKHSRGTTVRIAITARGGTVEFDITDNGSGLSPAGEPGSTRPGHGLHNMRERLRAIGGCAEIQSTGHGTRVRFVIAVPQHVASQKGIHSM